MSHSLELTPVAAPRLSMRMSSLAMGMNCPFILALMLAERSDMTEPFLRAYL